MRLKRPMRRTISLSLSLPDVPATDLVVTSITWVPVGEIAEGANVTFTATVKNVSENSTTRDFNVRFEIDNAFIGRTRITGDFPAGQERQVALTWTARVGLHEVKAIADSDQEVTESSESNNERIEALPEVAAPDLIVAELASSPGAEFSDGEQIPVFATIQNTGIGDTLGDFSVRFEVDGVFIGSQVVTGGLTAGQSKVASQGWIAQAGIHVLNATVDETNVVGETDEDNNTLALTLPDVPATDLVVTSIIWVPAIGIIGGQDVTLTATVKNISENSTTRDFNVRIEIDNVFLGQVRVTGDMPAGQERQVSLIWTAQVGVHEVKAVADADQEVTESTESNNERIQVLPEVVLVVQPDLIVAELTWSPLADFSDGEQIPVFATIQNIGNGAALGDFSVRFEVDGVFIGSQVVTGGLTAGQSKVASQVWTAQVGVHVLTAIVDETDVVGETDEDNNTLSLTFPDVPAADLVVTSIAWVPANRIIGGEDVTFTATVRNISENSTRRDFNVRFEIDNAVIGQVRVTGDMPAGQGRKVSLIWTAQIGVHEVKAVVDIDQEVTESTENNNERTETLPGVVDPNIFSVAGQVVLQARTNHSGVLVTFTDTATGGVYEVTGDDAGSFSIDLPPGTYDVVASHPGYLPAMRPGLVVGLDEPNSLFPVTLMGGDADRDGDVDFRDIRIIGNHFNTSDTDSDINGDGLVDIIDLAVSASNIGKTQTPWPANV